MIGSDGVWEFLTNERVCAIVSSFAHSKDAKKACDQIVNESVKLWKKEDCVIDDITATVIYFQN